VLGAAIVEWLVDSQNELCATVALADPRMWPHLLPEYLIEAARTRIDAKGDLSCSVPRFFRELLPSDFVVNREAASRSCTVVLSSWAVEAFPNWDADIFGV
jgi:hypothetical protein